MSRRNTQVYPPPKVPLTGHEERACLVLASLVISQPLPVLLSVPSASQPASWTPRKHDSGQVPYVTSNSDRQSWVCPLSLRTRWHRPPCLIILVPPLRPPCPADSLEELGKPIGGPWVHDPSQTIELPGVFSAGPEY